MFKEELKAMQEERQERHKYKGMIKDGGGPRGAGGAAGGEGGRGERDIKPAYQDASKLN